MKTRPEMARELVLNMERQGLSAYSAALDLLARRDEEVIEFILRQLEGNCSDRSKIDKTLSDIRALKEKLK